MMFQILITTRYFVGNAGAVHTVIATFDSKQAADIAIERIKESKRDSATPQIAIALY